MMAHAKFRPLSSIASYVFMADGNPGSLPPSKLFDEGEVRRYERSTSAAGDRHIRALAYELRCLYLKGSVF